MTTRGWRPRNDVGHLDGEHDDARASASPNINGRSEHTVKLHASAGIASASARTRSLGRAERDAEQEHRDARARETHREPDADRADRRGRARRT